MKALFTAWADLALRRSTSLAIFCLLLSAAAAAAGTKRASIEPSGVMAKP